MKQETKEIYLDRYANLLVNFCPRNATGINRGDYVLIDINEESRELLPHLMKHIARSGGYPLLNYIPKSFHLSGINYDFLKESLEENRQLLGGLEAYREHLFSLVNVRIRVVSHGNTKEISKSDHFSSYSHMHRSFYRNNPVYKNRLASGEFSYVSCVFPNEYIASQSNMTLNEYWEAFAKACYLDREDPVKHHQAAYAMMEQTGTYLTEKKPQYLHITTKDNSINLKIYAGKNRQWLYGQGRNMPSYEVFCSPDYRYTQGHISFNEPLYYQGKHIENIRLTFKDGKVVDFSSSTNQELLEKLLEIEGMKYIGEFSLTDKRVSPIDVYMGHLVFEENRGGEYGNMHIALGNAYIEGYTKDLSKASSGEKRSLGLNTSIDHKDIVNTKEKTVTAFYEDGDSEVIYKDGEFTFLDTEEI